MPQNHSTTLEVADKLRADYRPTTQGEWASGMLIIVVGALVAYGMFLFHKSKSPSAQAEANLKKDLNSELNELKGSMNDKHATLDKRVSLSEQEQRHSSERINTLEMTLNQNFTGLHKRFNKFEETILTLVIDKKS